MPLAEGVMLDGPNPNEMNAVDPVELGVVAPNDSRVGCCESAARRSPTSERSAAVLDLAANVCPKDANDNNSWHCEG